MSSKGVSGIGATLKRNSILIAEIIKMTGPGHKRKTIDVTSLSSADGYDEFIGGLRSSGQLALELVFRKDQYVVLTNDFQGNVLTTFLITLNDSAMTSDGKSTTFSFSAFVADLSLAIPLDDKITATATLQISGKVTIASV